jgi:hypothetical protein
MSCGISKEETTYSRTPWTPIVLGVHESTEAHGSTGVHRSTGVRRFPSYELRCSVYCKIYRSISLEELRNKNAYLLCFFNDTQG